MPRVADLVGYDRAETSVVRAASIPAVERELAAMSPVTAAVTRTTGTTYYTGPVERTAFVMEALDFAFTCDCWVFPHPECTCPHHGLIEDAARMIADGYPEEAVRGAYLVMREIIADEVYEWTNTVAQISSWYRRMGGPRTDDDAADVAAMLWVQQHAAGENPHLIFTDEAGYSHGQCEVCGEEGMELRSVDREQLCWDCYRWIAAEPDAARPLFMERALAGALPISVQGGSIVADPYAPYAA